MRKVCVITGTRANYGRLKPVMNAIKEHNELELKLIVTGMHLLPEMGYTVNEIEKDGYKIDAKVDMHIVNDSGAGMSKSLGLALIGITQAIESISPDIILILGDRDEDLAGAIIGAHMNIPVAHMHGGEVTGTIDESIRHAITKFSHIHLAASQESVKRLIKLGEIKDNIYNVGSPGLDSILNLNYKSKDYIFDKFNINKNKKLILVAQHPVTSESDKAKEQMKQTMEALKEIGEETIIIYPNNDSGSKEMIEVIESYSEVKYFQTYRNIKFEDYLHILKYADLMVGNSSSGIMEAPSYKLPAINIGVRQEGREQSDNIITVNPIKSEIKDAIIKGLYDEEFINKVNMCFNPYGDGKTGKRVANILSKIIINKKLIQKKITY